MARFNLFVIHLIVCVSIAGKVNSQQKLVLSVKPELAIPISDFQSIYKTGYGGHIQFMLRGTGQTNFTASLGYLTFNRKPPLYRGKGSLVPLRVGIQTFVARPFFLSGEAGAAFSSGALGKDPYYGFTAGPGVSFDAKNSIISIAGNYNIYFLHGTNIQWIGLTAAYGFKL